MMARNDNTDPGKEFLEFIIQFICSAIIAPLIAIAMAVGGIVVFIAGFYLFLALIFG